MPRDFIDSELIHIERPTIGMPNIWIVAVDPDGTILYDINIPDREVWYLIEGLKCYHAFDSIIYNGRQWAPVDYDNYDPSTGVMRISFQRGELSTADMMVINDVIQQCMTRMIRCG